MILSWFRPLKFKATYKQRKGEIQPEEPATELKAEEPGRFSQAASPPSTEHQSVDSGTYLCPIF